MSDIGTKKQLASAPGMIALESIGLVTAYVLVSLGIGRSNLWFYLLLLIVAIPTFRPFGRVEPVTLKNKHEISGLTATS